MNEHLQIVRAAKRDGKTTLRKTFPGRGKEAKELRQRAKDAFERNGKEFERVIYDSRTGWFLNTAKPIE